MQVKGSYLIQKELIKPWRDLQNFHGTQASHKRDSPWKISSNNRGRKLSKNYLHIYTKYTAVIMKFYYNHFHMIKTMLDYAKQLPSETHFVYMHRFLCRAQKLILSQLKMSSIFPLVLKSRVQNYVLQSMIEMLNL